MLREARIIMPTLDNNREPLGVLHNQLSALIVDHFNGVTVTKAEGLWRDPRGAIVRDCSLVYHIAASQDDAPTLRMMAGWAALEGRQECVYLTLPNGAVEFVKPAAWHAASAQERRAALHVV